MNSIILITIVCILLVVILVLLIMLKKSKNKNITASSNSNLNIDESEFNNRFDFSNIEIPLKIRKFDSYTLNQACNAVYTTFKVLDYSSSPIHSLEKTEWHVWQVSMLLRMIKLNKDFYIPSDEYTFHPSIIKMSSDEKVVVIQHVLKKYEDNVNVKKSKDELCKEMFCSGKEISCIFYYLINKEEF